MLSTIRVKLAAWLRRDGLVILLFAVAVVVMTYPLAFRPAEGRPDLGGPSQADGLTALWQVWWLGESVARGQNPNFSPILFYPNGLDITFQPRRWAALGTWIPLRSLLGDVAGFNVSVLLGLFVSAYAAYLLIHFLTHERAAAWLGGAFYAFYPAHVIRVLQQPNTGSIQWIPLFMLGLVAGLERTAGHKKPRRDRLWRELAPMVPAAFALSLNAYVSVKLWMQAVVLGGLYVALAAAANGWWRRSNFWVALGVLAFCSLLFAMPVLSPFLLAGSSLEYAIETGVTTLGHRGTDALSFVKAAPELRIFMPRSLARIRGIPFTAWGQGNSLYLGLTSLFLALLGVWDAARRDRRRLLWLVVALVLWGLSLGTRLWVGGQPHPSLWTPYRLVAWNPFFQAVRTPHRFALGFALPWAVLVGFGTARLCQLLQERKWLIGGVVACLAALMLFELAEVPITLTPLPVSPFYSQVLAADEQEGAIIDLPMGRQESKWYMYLQTHHHRPIVEGTVARTPAGAYDYITANPLLRAWNDREPLSCAYDVGQALEDLYADGFRYVVVHRKKPGKWLRDYFANVTPLYQDDIIVYRLDDLRSAPVCPGT